MAVTMSKSDLHYILEQIKIAEAHAAGAPLYGPDGLVPAYTVSAGLRTVDGTYNHLLPGQETWGSAGQQFPELLTPQYRTAGDDMNGPPGRAYPASYAPSNNPGSLVVDPSLRTISNLVVDQTLGNPAAILVALQRAGSADPMGDLALGERDLRDVQADLRERVPDPHRGAERARRGQRDRRARPTSRRRKLPKRCMPRRSSNATTRASCATPLSSRTASPCRTTTSACRTFRPTRACRRRSTPGSRCSASSSTTASTSSTRAAAARCSSRCRPTTRCTSRAATPTSWC